MFQVEVFWVVTPCSFVVGYQSFGGPCCVHLLGCVAVLCCGRIPTFRTSMLPLSSGWSRNPEDLDLKHGAEKDSKLASSPYVL